jgi:hypothetical protein
MKLYKDVRADAVAGIWVKYPNEESEVELCIRPIPASKALDIERKHLGKKRSFTVSDDGFRTVDLDLEAMDRISFDKAKYALLDSKNASVEVGDEDSRAFYSKLAKKELQVGDEFILDGNWVYPLKDRLFPELHDLVAFVVAKSAELSKEEADKSASLKSGTGRVD